jgi:hypothetical protein
MQMLNLLALHPKALKPPEYVWFHEYWRIDGIISGEQIIESFQG